MLLASKSHFCSSYNKPVGLGSRKYLNISSLEGSKNVGSHIKTKIEHFRETGEVLKYTPRQYENKSRNFRAIEKSRAARSSYSLQKALLVLRAKYDSHIFQNENGEILSLQKLTPTDMSVHSPKSLVIFKNLINFKKISGKRIDQKLMMTLLGTNLGQVRDPYLVTKEVGKLLSRDKEIMRAEYLGRIAGPGEGVVAMNTILEHLLQKGDVTAALKHFSNRKKWSVPLNEQSYVILFSGIARAYEWGEVPNEICEKCIQIYQELRSMTKQKANHKTDVRCEISHFNSCLSLLVKNFKQEQSLAWSFFDLLLPDPKSELRPLYPDCQTFTIFLNGTKKYTFHISDEIHNQRTLSKQEKRNKLLVVHGRLIKTAEEVLAKVFIAATPPTPPTREEARMNPTLLHEYRNAIRKPLVDIDERFIATFLSCFINKHSRTCFLTDENSHYAYVKEGLSFLKVWCPQIEQIIKELKGEAKTDGTFEPSERVKNFTDRRMLSAIGDKNQSSESTQLLPESLINSLGSLLKNPLVSFPPPQLSKNKTKAVFSGKKKHLIDLTRPIASDIKKIILDKDYRTSKGKFGKKLKHPENVSLEKRTGINKFLISLYLDGLLSLGRDSEYVASVWLILNRWGGITFDKGRVKQIDHLSRNPEVFTENEFPKFINSNGSIPIDYAASPKSEYFEQVVDIKLVEKVIIQINENFKQQGKTGTRISLEVISSIVNKSFNLQQGLQARSLTFEILFGNMTNDLHYFNDFNYNRETIDKARKGIPNNTPKKSIAHSQLSSFLDNLVILVNCLLVHESQVHKQSKYLLPNIYIDAYNRLIDRVYSTTWISIDEFQVLQAHKKILKSGILLYKPKALINPTEKLHSSQPILKSLEYVYQQLKATEDSSKQDERLRHLILQLFQLREDSESARKRLAKLTARIYDAL